MKKASRKLALDRETLVSLQGDEIDQVNGGVTPAITSDSLSPVISCGPLPPQTIALSRDTRNQ